MGQTTELIIHSTNANIGENAKEILRGETDAYQHDEPDITRGTGVDLWFITIETRWTVDGIDNAAALMSKQFGCEVELGEAWDNRDADEPGSRSVVYDQGALRSEGRELQVPAYVGEVVAVPVDTLREWRSLLEAHPFPEVSRVVVAIGAALP